MTTLTTPFGSGTFTLVGPDHLSHWQDADYLRALELAVDTEVARGVECRTVTFPLFGGGRWHVTWHEGGRS